MAPPTRSPDDPDEFVFVDGELVTEGSRRGRAAKPAERRSESRKGRRERRAAEAEPRKSRRDRRRDRRAAEAEATADTDVEAPVEAPVPPPDLEDSLEPPARAPRPVRRRPRARRVETPPDEATEELTEPPLLDHAPEVTPARRRPRPRSRVMPEPEAEAEDAAETVVEEPAEAAAPPPESEPDDNARPRRTYRPGTGTVAAPPSDETAPVRPRRPRPSRPRTADGEEAPTRTRRTRRAVGEPPSDGCSVCGRAPARRLTVRRHVGLVLLVRHSKAEGLFCREHGEAVSREYLRRTLAAGWWWLLGILINWHPILVDLSASRQARKIPLPEEGSRRRGQRRSPRAEGAPAAPTETPEARAGRLSASAAAVIAIGLGIVVQVGAFFLLRDSEDRLAQRTTIASVLILGLYAAVALVAARVVGRGRVRPRLLEGDGVKALAIGFLYGLVAAVIAIALLSLVSGRLSSDSYAMAVLAEHNDLNIALVFLTLAVLAPLIEETLFRGLLVESLRARGRWSAVLAGAVLFALWHVRPSTMSYYIFIGVLLGLVYWRYGLAGSISMHATFNFTLFFVAVIALSTGPQVFDRGGLHFELPAAWTDTTEPGSGVDLEAESRTGATLFVVHRTAPPVAAGPQDLRLPPDARSPESIVVGGVPGIRFHAVGKDGEPTEVIVFQRGDRRWEMTLTPEGSEQAERDFDRMIATLQITGA